MADKIVYIKGEKYAFPDSMLSQIMEEYPDAEFGVDYMIGGERYSIPKSKEASILEQYPDASLVDKTDSLKDEQGGEVTPLKQQPLTREQFQPKFETTEKESVLTTKYQNEKLKSEDDKISQRLFDAQEKKIKEEKLDRQDEVDFQMGHSRTEMSPEVDNVLNITDKFSDIIDNPSQLVPFLSGISDAYELTDLVLRAKRLEENKATEEDIKVLTEYVDINSRDTTFGYDVLSIISQLPAFGVELGLTSGIYSAGKKATLIAGKKALQKLFTKKGKDLLEKRAVDLGLKSVAGIAGASLQTIPAGATRITAATIENIMPSLGFTENEEGDIELIVSQPGDNAFLAFGKALGDTWVEILSERSGGLFGELGKGFSKLTDPLKEKAIKRGILQSFLRKNPNKKLKDFKKVLRRYGWNGIVSEMLEERVGDVGRAGLATIGLSDYEFELPSLRQLATEAVAFSIPGAGIALTGRAVKKFDRTPKKEETVEKPQDKQPVKPVEETAETVQEPVEETAETADIASITKRYEENKATKEDKRILSEYFGFPIDKPKEKEDVTTPEPPKKVEAEEVKKPKEETEVKPIETKSKLSPNQKLTLKNDYKRYQDIQQNNYLELGNPNLGGNREIAIKNSIEQSDKKLSEIEDIARQNKINLPTKVTDTKAKKELVEALEELDVDSDVSYKITEETITVADQIASGKVDAESALAGIEADGYSVTQASELAIKGYNYEEIKDGVTKDVMVATKTGDPSTVIHERGEVYYRRKVKSEPKFDEFITKERENYYKRTGEKTRGESNQEWFGNMTQTYALSDAPVTGFSAKFKAILKKFRKYGKALMTRVSAFNEQLKKGQVSKELQDVLESAIAKPLPKRADAKKPAKATKKKKVKGYELEDDGKKQLAKEKAYKYLPQSKALIEKRAKNLNISIKRSPETSKPKNKKKVFENDKFRITIGDKTFLDWIKDVEKNLTKKEIQEASNWYYELYEGVKKLAKNKVEAEKFLVSWLAAQANMNPMDAASATLRVREEVLTGTRRISKEGKEVQSGGLNDAAIRRIFAGKAAEKGMGAKLLDFLDSGIQSDTRFHMNNDPRGGSPYVVDRHTWNGRGYVSPVFGRYIKRNFPKQAKNYKFELDNTKDDSPSSAQYEQTSRWGNKLTTYLNEINWQGRSDWTTQAVQAVDWTSITKFKNVGGTLEEGIALNTIDFNYEIKFGDGTPLLDMFPEVMDLKKKDALRLNKKLAKFVQKVIEKEFKPFNIQVYHGTGGWQGDISPNIKKKIVIPKDKMEEVMAVVGYLTQQTSVIGVVNNENGKDLVLNFSAPEFRKSTNVNAFYEYMYDKHPDIFKGFSTSIVTTNSGQTLPTISIYLNSKYDYKLKGKNIAQRKIELDRISQEIVDLIQSDVSLFPIARDIEITANNANIFETENNWKVKGEKNGESYLHRLSESGQRGLQERLSGDYRQQYQSIIEKEVKEKIKIKGYEVEPLTKEQKAKRTQREKRDAKVNQKKIDEIYKDLKSLSDKTYVSAKQEAEELSKKTGEPPPPIYAGSVNLDKQEIDSVLKALQINLSKLKPKKKQTWDETGVIRDEILSDYDSMIKVLNRAKVGGILNAPEVDVLRTINVNAVNRLSEIAQSGSDIDSVNAIKQYYQDIFETLNNVSSELGRALNILKKGVSQASVARALGKLKRDLNEREYKEFQEINWENPLEVKRFIDRLGDPRLQDYVFEFWYNNILSGIPTHIVNIASNTLWGLYQIPFRALSGSVDAMISKFTGRQRQRFVREIIPMMAGFKTGASKGFKRAYQTVKTGQIPLDIGTKWDLDMGGSVSAFERSPNAAVRSLAPWLTVFSKALRAMDVFANSIAFDAQINALAYREAKKQNLKGKELENKVNEIKRKPTDKMIDSAKEYARYATFMDKPDRFTQWFSQLRGKRFVGGGFRFLIPFVNTISNITKRGFEITPGLGLLRHKDYFQGKNEGYKNSASDIISKQIVGVMLSALILSLYDEEILTGAVPKAKNKREAFYRQGKLPWAIKIGKKYYSYRRIEPFNTVLASATIVAQKMEEYDDGKIEEIGDLLYQMSEGVVNNLLDSSMLDALSDLFDRYGKGRTRIPKRILTSFVPYSSFFRSINRSLEVSIEGSAKAREAKSLSDGFAQVLPFGTLFLKPKMNVWGEEIVLEGGVLRQWLPFKWRDEKSDPVEDEFERVKFYPSLPPKKIEIDGKSYKVPDKLYEEFVLNVGRLYKKRLSEEGALKPDLPPILALDEYYDLLEPIKRNVRNIVIEKMRVHYKIPKKEY